MCPFLSSNLCCGMLWVFVKWVRAWEKRTRHALATRVCKHSTSDIHVRCWTLCWQWGSFPCRLSRINVIWARFRWNQTKDQAHTFLTYTVYYIFSTWRHYCPFVQSVVILRLFNDFATDLLAVWSGLRMKVNMGPKTALETPMSSGYHTCWLSNLPVPPPQQLLDELMLVLSSCLKPLHDCIIELVHVEHAV